MTAPVSMTWSELLSALRSVPERLVTLTSEATHDSTSARSNGDDWSVCQIVGHMCAVESPYRARLVRISLENHPRVAAISCLTGDYDPETPIAILVETFAILRRETVRFLENLAPLARGRTAVHAELGDITLRSQVEALSAHDEEHLAQIARLLEKQAGKEAGGSHG